MSFELVQTTTEPARLEAHRALFARCFPEATHFTPQYLQWLYAENPAGQVVGVDAMVGDRLAATYVTIPARLRVEGSSVRGLLSLNTATDPDFQGKGLFTRLATAVFERSAAAGYGAVYGVANANSTPGFVRKLGFQLLEPLRAAVGWGPSYCRHLEGAWREARLVREWPAEDLAWRQRNPANPLTARGRPGGLTEFRGATGYPLLHATAFLPGRFAEEAGQGWAPSVYIGVVPAAFRRRGAYLDVPDRLRPSPLNLIFRSLAGAPSPSAGQSFISFLDFDAF